MEEINWQSVIAICHKEWRRVKLVRKSFLTLLALCLLIGWGGGWYVLYGFMEDKFAVQISNKDSTIENLQTRVDGYESKLNVDSPDQAEAKLGQLQEEIERLKDTTPKLEIRKKEWNKQEDGTWIYSIRFHSSTKLTPNGLHLAFDADGIMDLKLISHNEKNTQAEPIERGHDKSIYIQKPFGYYTLMLHLKERVQVKFSWTYDGFSGAVDVSR